MAIAEIEQPSDSLLWMALRELRLARVLTQRELAEQAGISVKTLNDVEQFKVRPQPNTLRKLARALGVNVTMLADHMDPEAHRPTRPNPRPFPEPQ